MKVHGTDYAEKDPFHYDTKDWRGRAFLGREKGEDTARSLSGGEGLSSPAKGKGKSLTRERYLPPP